MILELVGTTSCKEPRPPESPRWVVMVSPGQWRRSMTCQESYCVLTTHNPYTQNRPERLKPRPICSAMALAGENRVTADVLPASNRLALDRL